MRLRSGSNGARGVAGFAAGFARIARLSALLSLSLLALGATALSFAPVAHADSVSLAILVPKTQSNTAEGPVGTNVTISGQGATAGHGYQLSAALTGPGCPTGGPLGTATADANGKFTTTVEWPDTASAVGATYVICYKDTSAGPALAQNSDQKFKVDAGSPPSITLAPPPSPTPNTGNPPHVSRWRADPDQRQELFLEPHAVARLRDAQPEFCAGRFAVGERAKARGYE